VWAWGYNGYGELGNGTTTSSIAPVQVAQVSDAVGIAGGDFHSLFETGNGLVEATGRNDNGQLGNGTATNATSPVQVNNLTGVAPTTITYTDLSPITYSYQCRIATARETTARTSRAQLARAINLDHEISDPGHASMSVQATCTAPRRRRQAPRQ